MINTFKILIAQMYFNLKRNKVDCLRFHVCFYVSMIIKSRILHFIHKNVMDDLVLGNKSMNKLFMYMKKYEYLALK